METIFIGEIPTAILVERLEALPLKPSKTLPGGRTCQRWGYITVISIYNPGPTCFAHTHDEFRLLMGGAAA